MLSRKPELKEVTLEMFEIEMAPVNEDVRIRINSYISLHQDSITKYEFGYIPGERVFRITLSNGKVKTWDLTRHRQKRNFMREFFTYLQRG